MSISSTDEDRRSIRFAEGVGPDSSIVETYEVDRDLTVEQLRVRIYRGAELDLEVSPFVDREKADDRQRREPLIVYRGSEYIAGDGDTFVFPVSVSVEEGQQLGVKVVNQDDTYSYDFSVDMTVDPAGGSSRLVSLLGGVF